MNESQKGKLREVLLMCKSLRDSMEFSLHADPDNIWKYATYKQLARRYNDLATHVGQTINIDVPLYLFDLAKINGPADTIALQQKEIFESVHAELSLLIAYLENKIGIRKDEIQNLKNFLQANLRRAVFETPEKENQIQNIIEQLLIGRGLSKGLDYDRETGRVKVSAKEVVPDFIFLRLKLALEVKLLKESARIGSLIDQINADIRSYSKSYPYILFLIYDLGAIRDENEFRVDLESADGVTVIIIKH